MVQVRKESSAGNVAPSNKGKKLPKRRVKSRLGRSIPGRKMVCQPEGGLGSPFQGSKTKKIKN